MNPVVQAATGSDISRKASARKGKYLFAFPGKLAAVAGAAQRLGTLSQVKSGKPVMTIEFEEGRLRLLGTVLKPRGKFLTLRVPPKPKGSVTCEDVFDSVVAFSDAVWIGKKDENEHDAPLAMPDSIFKVCNRAAVALRVHLISRSISQKPAGRGPTRFTGSGASSGASAVKSAKPKSSGAGAGAGGGVGGGSVAGTPKAPPKAASSDDDGSTPSELRCTAASGASAC